MADFDLTQTDVQVQSILNDAQNAQGAGAQTTLTTDYIMLKDTSGSYHKILKDSFTEACRNVLAGLLVNNNKGTSVSQIPVVASGDFGSVTPANLASVLGVNRFIGIMPNNTSVKNLAYGRYIKNSSVTGVTGYPSSVTGSFVVEVVSDSGDNSISHIWLYDITIPGDVYYNIKWGGSWRGWRKVTATTVEE